MKLGYILSHEVSEVSLKLFKKKNSYMQNMFFYYKYARN